MILKFERINIKCKKLKFDHEFNNIKIEKVENKIRIWFDLRMIGFALLHKFRLQ